MGFLGTYADLRGLRVRDFFVEGLVTRDATGAPVWRVACQRCLHTQSIPHSRLAPLVQGRRTQQSLQCGNPGCEFSRYESQLETISQFRQREERQAEQAAKTAAEAQRAADERATKESAERARLEAAKASYRIYWNHQIKTTIPESTIASLSQWCELSENTRQQVLEICRSKPNVWIQGI